MGFVRYRTDSYLCTGVAKCNSASFDNLSRVGILTWFHFGTGVILAPVTNFVTSGVKVTPLAAPLIPINIIWTYTVSFGLLALVRLNDTN